MISLFNFNSFARLLHTLADIGLVRLQRRFRYEIRQRIDRRLPAKIALAWSSANSPYSPWRTTSYPSEDAFPSIPILANSDKEIQYVSFKFLNQERQLPWPVSWNDPSWSRLWKFNLHYFDWSREWLDNALKAGYWPAFLPIVPLLDSWILSDSPGSGDGWHSYTLSLRTRNWIYLFRTCPNLITPERLQSLWQQLCWLQAHPERCHGGNHWLENLTALALGGLQFDGHNASRMHCRAMTLLQNELADQILLDGGHIERSASYHLLMLDRLSDLACALEKFSIEQPIWLIKYIQSMTKWAQLIRLEGGLTPRFNDSAADAAPPIDEVLERSYNTTKAILVDFDCLPVQPISDLWDTGWTFLRPGYGWELVFKCGIPCSNHLPGHVHSDQLSFELAHHGRWLISEAGTSVYGHSPERTYERSGSAHNVLQLGIRSSSGVIRWIEPVDVWDGFRAGRKAQPRDRAYGNLKTDSYFVSGSNNGFDHIGASHHRCVVLSDPQEFQIKLDIIDTITTSVTIDIRQWFHPGPEMSSHLFENLVLDALTLEDAEFIWQPTWFSLGFGHRISRKSLCLIGRLSPGEHQIRCTIPLISQSL